MNLRPPMATTLACTLLVCLAFLHLRWGEVPMDASDWWAALLGTGGPSPLHATILWEVRMPRMLTAASAGVLLGWLGMLLQTWFRNPLAGPGVLGITSGGSLGVALAVLAGLTAPTWVAASAGCLTVLVLIAAAAKRFVSPVTTLVFGLMVSYAVGSAVTLLQASASAESLQSFIFWGMGTFGKSTLWQAGSLGALVLVSALWVVRRSGWLDTWTLGEDMAQTMGVPPAQFQSELLLLSGVVVGWVTSLCGPLAFLGLATPHVHRFFSKARSHRAMMGGVAMWGAVLALLSDGVVRVTDAGGAHWPLNAVLALFGAPVVVAVLWKRTLDWS